MKITIRGYRGQGVRTLARILSRSGMLAGLNSQDFYKTGNIVEAHVRIEKDPILERGPITTPETLILLDSSLFLAKEAKDNLQIIINSAEKPKAVVKVRTVHTLDASEIAFKNTGKGIPNTTLAGAVTKFLPKLQIKHVKQSIELEIHIKQKENTMAAEEGLKVVR
jgi:2-oxoacid:acceptor oxidoreductase gamma subunit (pyruvate/2-ketoisovalerate family)